MVTIIETIFDVGQELFGLRIEPATAHQTRKLDQAAGPFRAMAEFVRVSP